MPSSLLRLSLSALLLLPFGTQAADADLLLHNARVYTVDEQRSWAQAIAVTDGRFVYVGDDEGAAAHRGPATRVIDMKGGFLLPSFQDTHAHPVWGGVAQLGCPVFDLESSEALLAAINACVEKTPGNGLIQGSGWTWDQFGTGGSPHKAMLDKIAPRRPLVFGDADGHSLWLNSAALKLAGIDADTLDPPGGEIGRDPKTGEPNGLLLEDSAMNLLMSKIPPTTPEAMREGLVFAQQYFNRLGITALQDAQVKVSGTDASVSLPVYRAMADADELTLRVVAALYWDPDKGLEQVAEFEAARKKYSGGRLQATAVKFWADGIVESYTAKMLEPYTDKPDTSGLLMVPLKELLQGVSAVDKQGFQVHIHAIGTATVRYALDAIEQAQRNNGMRDGRPLLAHIQLVHPDDIPRFGKLGVTASFQPLWAYADTYVTDINPPQLGPKRMEWMYPIASIARQGGMLGFGSDWSVSSANPFPAIEIAITRQDPETSTSKPLVPSEAIKLDQAIAGYTIGAAHTNFLDEHTGSIEVGKYADFILVDRNVFEIPVTDISEAKVLGTVLEGDIVYGALTPPASP